MEQESDGDTNCYRRFRYSQLTIVKWTGGLGNNDDHSNLGIVKIGQNTEKTPTELRSLPITQTPEYNNRLTLVWKTYKGIIIIIRRLEDYITKHEGGLITAIRNDTDNTMDKRMQKTWKQK